MYHISYIKNYFIENGKVDLYTSDAGIDLDIGVDYDSDMKLVSETLLNLAKDKRVLDKPKKPEFIVVKYDDSSIIVRLRLYSDNKNWYSLYTDLMKMTK